MKVLLAFDKYKGSLNAVDVSAAVERGLRQVFPRAEYSILPIADGGEGFTQSLVKIMNGHLETADVEDALGRKVKAEWGVIPWEDGKLAGVIEMSAASGLWRISEEERCIMTSSTYGTGELIKIASNRENIRHLFLGLGGSATNDAGMGMASALGVSHIGVAGRVCPQTLINLSHIDLTTCIPLPSITVACDVDNPLCGENGASAIFGPQKGASTKQVNELDSLLSKIADLSPSPELQHVAGAGAAGGLGFGMMAFTGANLVPGFELVSDAIQLEEAISRADIVMTGEGGLDAQSLSGKGPIGVAKLARKHNKPCYGLAGIVDKTQNWAPYFKNVYAVADNGEPVASLMANASQFIEETASQLASKIR